MKKFHRAIFFTKVPLGGYYQYKDLFQIFPADLEDMPKSKLQKHFPNILEFWTSEDDKKTVSSGMEEYEDLLDGHQEIAAFIVKANSILDLLSGFTNYRFFRYDDSSGNWGMPILNDEPTDEEANGWSSKWCLQLFNFPKLPAQLRIEKFSDIKLPVLKRIEHLEYFLKYPNIDDDRTKEILFPETIDKLFDSYFSLQSNEKHIIDSAVSYSVSAIDLLHKKKTLSLLSSFTSLETMVNLEYIKSVPEKCECCGQQKFSIAKKFREYLLKYIGNSEVNKRKFNSYYKLRSKIVHTGIRLKTELLFSTTPVPEKEDELITRMEILQIGKLAITNWLLKRS
jgi:hypothetical protein